MANLHDESWNPVCYSGARPSDKYPSTSTGLYICKSMNFTGLNSVGPARKSYKFSSRYNNEDKIHRLQCSNTHSCTYRVGWGCHVYSGGRGRYRTSAHHYTKISCQGCGAGFFKSGATCIPCPANSYKPANSADSTCAPCPANSTSSPGSVACLCKAGFYTEHFYSHVIDHVCRRCPTESTSTRGAHSCVCSGGYHFNVTSGHCEGGGVGEYQDTDFLTRTSTESREETVTRGEVDLSDIVTEMRKVTPVLTTGLSDTVTKFLRDIRVITGVTLAATSVALFATFFVWYGKLRQVRTRENNQDNADEIFEIRDLEDVAERGEQAGSDYKERSRSLSCQNAEEEMNIYTDIAPG